MPLVTGRKSDSSWRSGRLGSQALAVVDGFDVMDMGDVLESRKEDYEPCSYFERNFKALCPNAWIEKWNDQKDRGAFPAKLD